MVPDGGAPEEGSFEEAAGTMGLPLRTWYTDDGCMF